MNREEIITILSDKVKLIRTEYNFTQEKMANVLGLSKKTLVEIEKGRKKMGWTVAIALCAVFRESDILKMTLGEDPVEVVEIIAFETLVVPKNKTMGGKVWWRVMKEEKGFMLQQNILSGHYRILDKENKRWFSSFELNDMEERFQNLIQS